MSDEMLIKVEGVRKKFCRSLRKSLWYGVTDMATEVVGGKGSHDTLRDGEFWAVNDVSFSLRRGECLGLIGRNGAGKTTLLKMLNGLIKPDHGRIEMRGRVGALIALGAGFNPILTGRENIYVNASILGLSKREIDAKIDEIVDFAEIHEFIDSPVQSYSSGMQVRLGFSVATVLEPDILLLDEVLAVGDMAFRVKCFNRLGKILSRCAVIFVTHSMHQVYRLCNSVIVMRNGTIDLNGAPPEAVARYETICRGNDAPESARFLDGAVRHFEASIDRPAIKSGESFSVRLHLKASARVRLGLVIFNLTSQNGTLAAERRQRIEDGEVAADGEWIYDLSLGTISLRQGTYTYNVAIYDDTQKVNLAHLVNPGTIEVVNPIGTEAVMTI